MIRYPNFERHIYPPQILSRGENVYSANLITEVRSNGPNKWKAIVTSEADEDKEYNVTIEIRNGIVSRHRCSCPYRLSNICKHRVAVLFHIRNGDLTGDSESSDEVDEYEDGEEEDEYSDDDDDESDSSSERSEKEDKKKQATSALQTQVSVNFNTQEEEVIGPNLVKRELECQICLSDLDKPVFLPCQAHSLCYSCITHLISIKKKERNGYKHISCPTCGVDSGTLKVKTVKDVKINKELERVKKAYEAERVMWVDEKLKLETELNMKKEEIKNLKEAEQKALANALKQDQPEKKEPLAENQSIDSTEELTRKIKVLSVNKMKDLAKAILEELKSKGENVESLLSPPKMEKENLQTAVSDPPKAERRKRPAYEEKQVMKVEKKNEPSKTNAFLQRYIIDKQASLDSNESLESLKILKKTKK